MAKYDYKATLAKYGIGTDDENKPIASSKKYDYKATLAKYGIGGTSKPSAEDTPVTQTGTQSAPRSAGTSGSNNRNTASGNKNGIFNHAKKTATSGFGKAAESGYTAEKKAAAQQANRQTVKNWWKQEQEKAAEDDSTERARTAKLTSGASIDNSKSFLANAKKTFGGVKDDAETQRKRALDSKMGVGENWGNPKTAVGNAVESAAAGSVANYLNALGTLLQDDGKRQGLAVDSGDIEATETDTWHNRWGEYLQGEADRVQKISEDAYARGSEGLSNAQRILYDVGIAGAQMLGDKAFGAAAPIAMAVRGFGGGSMQARQEGGSHTEQIAYGSLSAGLEFLTEKMFDGVAHVYGKGAADDVVQKVAEKLAKTPQGQSVIRALMNAGGEGLEEMISAVVDPALQTIYNDKEINGKRHGKTGAYDGVKIADILYDGLIGTLLGFTGGAVDIAQTARGERAVSGNLQTNEKTGVNLNRDGLQATTNEKTGENFNREGLQATENKKSSPVGAMSESAEGNQPAIPVAAEARLAAETSVEAQQKQEEAEVPRLLTPEEHVAKLDDEAVERILEAFTVDDGYVSRQRQEQLIGYHGEDLFYRAVEEGFQRGLIANDGAGNIYSLKPETRKPGYYGGKGKEAKYLDSLAKAANMTILRGDLDSGEMGFYINGRAVLAKDAGVEIARHEVAHHLKQAAPEEFNAFLDYVKGTYGEELTGAMEDIRRGYAERGETLSDAVAEEELAAYYAGRLMTDETAMKRLAGENLNLAERILAWIKESLAKLRRAFGGEDVETKRLREAAELFENAIRAAKSGTVESGSVRHAYAGQGAKTADLNALQTAQNMVEAGIDVETVRKETGWFKGMDGKWRFEIDDRGMVYRRSGDAKYARDPEYLEYNELWEKAYGYGEASEAELARLRELDAKYSRITQQSSANLKNGNATLEDVLQHDELFENYPQLRNVNVVFAELENGTNGFYNLKDNAIYLDKSLRNNPTGTLLHEIQHVIQKIEGFGRGASPEYWANQKSSGFSMRQNDRRIMAAEKEYRKIWNSAPEEMKDLVRARNRATLAEDWGAVLAIEDQLYKSEYSELFGKLDMADFARRGDRGEELTSSELYYNTAGEIEARDVASRRDLTTEQRKEKTPDLGDENTVFADGEAGWALEADAESTSIKEQIEKSAKVLNEMPVVVSAVVPTNIKSKDEAAKWATEQLKNTGYRVDKQGYGEIFFSKKDIDKGLRYADTPAERAAVVALPQVLKKGIEIGQHTNHKGRSKQTITFAAPVELNGTRGNMAVVVNRNGNHYYAHRIVLPDGTEFRFSENKNNTAQELSRGVTIAGSLADTTSAVSANSIPPSAGKSNTQNSGKRSAYAEIAEKLDERQRLQRQNERLEEQLWNLRNRVQGVPLAGTDRVSVRKQVQELKKRYGSKVSTNELTDAVVEFYDGIMDRSYTDEEMRQKAREIADRIIDGAAQQVNPMHEEYEDLRKMLRSRRIALDEADRADLAQAGGYNAIRRRNMGRLTLAKDGTAVDALYEQLSEDYPNLFPDDIYSPADQLIQISDVLDELAAVEDNPFSQTPEVREFLAGDILERYFDTPQTYAAQLQRDRAAAEKRLQNVKEQHRQQLANVERAHQEENRRRREQATASERREQLMKGTERLAKKLVRPDDKRHIPAELRETVRSFVSMVNTESGFEWEFQRDGTYKRVKVGESPYGQTTARTDRARELMAEIRKLEEDGAVGIDPQLQSNLDAIVEMGETKVADMSREQLNTVYETMRAIEKMAQHYDKMLGESKYAKVSLAAEALREENTGRKTKTQYKGFLQAADDLAELDMMTPETFFHKMGKAGDELYRQMRRSADQQTRILKEGVDHAKKALESSGLDVKQLEQETHKFELESGETLTMTTAQIMNLHALWKREQARDHIGLGGIKPTKIESGKGLKATTAVAAEKVTLNDLANILKVLTPEQKAFVDELQKFMAGSLANHGNEASRAVYGYDKFTEKDYWPIRVNKDETQNDPGKEAQAKTIVGFGMAKAPKPEASNGLEIGSFMDVYTQHLSEMATYASWLATSENLTRVNNFKFTDAEGKPTGQTVKTLLTKIYGSGGNEYWKKLMGDIAQGTKTGSDGGFFDWLTGNTKAAAVGRNIRVVLQQPTSIIRAMNMVHPKYFVDKPHKGGWKKALKYSSIAQWKDWGYFEMDTGRSVRGLITGPESKVEKWREAGMALAGKADSATWGALWNAVERETRDRLQAREKAADEYNKLVSKPDVPVVQLSSNPEGLSYAELKTRALRKAAENGWFDAPYNNRDTGAQVFVSKEAYTHAFSNLRANWGEDTILAMEQLPALIENAVLTDSRDPKDPEKSEIKVHTLFAAVQGKNGVEPVKLTVKEYKVELGRILPQNVQKYFRSNGMQGGFSKLYDVVAIETGTKKESGASGEVYAEKRHDALTTPNSVISVAELMGLVNGEAKKYIPKRPTTVEDGSEAFYQLVAERFGEVVDRTQVVDSVLHRSQIMRKGGVNKMATSFMSEPMKTYNMVLRDIYDINAAADGPAKVRAKRRFAGTATALLFSFALNALAQSLVDAARDDDREQKYWEKFAEAYIGFTGEEKTLWDKHKAFWSGNLQGNFNPFSYVPYAKDVVSIVQGYDVTRMDMDAISDTVRAFQQFWKTVQDEHNRIKPQEDYEDKGQKTMFNAGLDLSSELLAAVGLPAANIKRDLLALVNTVFSAAGSYRMQYELDKLLYDIDYAANRKRWWKILYAASQDNWEDYVAIYNDMRKQGLTDKQIKTGMENMMTDAQGVDKVTELKYRWTPPNERSEFNTFSKQISETEGPRKALDLG